MSAKPTLVADIGGTNTRVALARGPAVDHATVRRFQNSEFGALEDVLAEFLADHPERNNIKRACFAVAGPVRDGEAELTNRNWTFSTHGLANVLGADAAHLLNDLQALGHALDRLPDGAVAPLMGERSTTTGVDTRLVVGIGTGFNTALVIETSAGREVSASESGHMGLPIRTDKDWQLHSHLNATLGFASVEDVISGPGLAKLYDWEGLNGPVKAKNGAEVIAGLDDAEDTRAAQAVEMFVRICASVIGDLALVQLPFGGIYLAGSVARAVAPSFDRFGFEQAFCDKGRFGDFMSDFPVYLIQDDFAALAGCAAYLANIE